MSCTAIPADETCGYGGSLAKKYVKYAADVYRVDKETTEANKKGPSLTFFVFPVTSECPRAPQGHFESKYFPWCAAFTRVLGVFADF